MNYNETEVSETWLLGILKFHLVLPIHDGINILGGVLYFNNWRGMYSKQVNMKKIA